MPSVLDRTRRAMLLGLAGLAASCSGGSGSSQQSSSPDLTFPSPTVPPDLKMDPRKPDTPDEGPGGDGKPPSYDQPMKGATEDLDTDDDQVPAPEPGTLLLMGLGVLGLTVSRRWRKREPTR